jgi:hypothetical protein
VTTSDLNNNQLKIVQILEAVAKATTSN